MIVALIGTFIAVIIADMPGLLKTNDRQKTMVIYFILILLGFSISLLQVMDKAPVTPSEIIKRMVDFILMR